MNSWQSGEVIAVRRKKCSGASSRPNGHGDVQCLLTYKRTVGGDGDNGGHGVQEYG